MNTNYELRDVERLTRFIMGFGIMLLVLVFPFTAEEIFIASIFAFYPLITALVARDPFFYVVESIIGRSTAATSSKAELAY